MARELGRREEHPVLISRHRNRREVWPVVGMVGDNPRSKVAIANDGFAEEGVRVVGRRHELDAGALTSL